MLHGQLFDLYFPIDDLDGVIESISFAKLLEVEGEATIRRGVRWFFTFSQTCCLGQSSRGRIVFRQHRWTA